MPSFREHFSFQEKAKRGFIFGPNVIILEPLLGYKVLVWKPNLTEYFPDSVKAQPYLLDLWVRLIAKPLIILISSGWIYALSKFIFQEWSLGLMKSSTDKYWSKNWSWIFGCADFERGVKIQGSFYSSNDQLVWIWLYQTNLWILVLRNVIMFMVQYIPIKHNKSKKPNN